jgi:diguanylate cyclase (GGDEF)-like protein
MNNATKLHQLNENDEINRLVFRHDHHIMFTFDWSQSPRIVKIISGDPTTLGLPALTEFPFHDIIPHIETKNELAEVEGRETFIASIRRRIDRLDGDMSLYIPFRHPEGKLWASVSLERISEENGKPKIVFCRIHQLSKETPREIIHYQRTYQDALTRLFTRETLKQHLRTLIVHPGTYAMYMDLDDFKRINDQFGHRRGDEFLIRLANEFIAVWEQEVVYYRLGGDEFFIIVYNHTEAQIIERAKKIIRLVESIHVDGHPGGVSASIGIVPITDQNKGYDTLLDLADGAMYCAKNNGKGQCILLTEPSTL